MTLGRAGLARVLVDGSLVVDPPPTVLQPASIDLHLADDFLHIEARHSGHIDLRDQRTFGHWQSKAPSNGLMIFTGELYLGRTIERVKLANDLQARVEGKSSLGRVGFGIHVTAGFIDPGFDGFITLELWVAGPAVKAYPGMPIAQLAVERIEEPGGEGYDGKYQHSDSTRPSEFWRNWDTITGKWK